MRAKYMLKLVEMLVHLNSSHTSSRELSLLDNRDYVSKYGQYLSHEDLTGLN